ncbi:MAG: AAA family ATPase [Pseudonocardia sp.]|nr:AAA family ATPase [Pseudonocardia sp.]
MRAAIQETHIGVVVLVGERAYKLKKAVRTAFCDFSTAELRHRALDRELALNRRLAPDVYLGTGEITEPGPDGVVSTEPMLVMCRMPAERRLSTLVLQGHDVREALRDTARLMAAFHARSERSPEITVEGGRCALTERWRHNLDELEPFRGDLVDTDVLTAVGHLALAFLQGRGPLFEDRQDRGRIVDGHGDLLPDDVFCLDDGPRLLDCLDFDDRLRHLDGLDDVAFLAMDLERLGAPAAARAFLDAYVEFSGDPAPVSLRHHYIAYRAVVRAKVACLRHAQGDPAAAGDAAAHLALALRHLERGAVRLVLVGGLPGTGKTSVGGGLADRVGAVLLSSDRIRKELAGIDPARSAASAFRTGLYDSAHTHSVYTELLRRAAALLGRGESVVLDASWTSAEHRTAAASLATRGASPLVQLECRTEAATARERLRSRGATPSDATSEIAAAMAEVAEPWPGSTGIRTTGSVAESVRAAEAAWTRSVRLPSDVLPTAD